MMSCAIGMPPVLLWSEQLHSLQYEVIGAAYSNEKSDKKNKKRKRDGDSSGGNIAQTPTETSLPEMKRSRLSMLGHIPRVVLNFLSFGFIPLAARNPMEQTIHPINKDKANMKPTTPHVKKPVIPLELVSIDPSVSIIPTKDAYNLVYLDLVKQGFLVGPGHLYGGDYNVYERGKDPSSSHSVATIRALSTPKITGRDLLSYSRVQNQVAKSGVFAFPDVHSNTVEGESKIKYIVVNFRSVSYRL
jgi:tRNA splicing endonuclease